MSDDNPDAHPGMGGTPDFHDAVPASAEYQEGDAELRERLLEDISKSVRVGQVSVFQQGSFRAVPVVDRSGDRSFRVWKGADDPGGLPKDYERPAIKFSIAHRDSVLERDLKRTFDIDPGSNRDDELYVNTAKIKLKPSGERRFIVYGGGNFLIDSQNAAEGRFTSTLWYLSLDSQQAAESLIQLIRQDPNLALRDVFGSITNGFFSEDHLDHRQATHGSPNPFTQRVIGRVYVRDFSGEVGDPIENEKFRHATEALGELTAQQRKDLALLPAGEVPQWVQEQARYRRAIDLGRLSVDGCSTPVTTRTGSTFKEEPSGSSVTRAREARRGGHLRLVSNSPPAPPNSAELLLIEPAAETAESIRGALDELREFYNTYGVSPVVIGESDRANWMQRVFGSAASSYRRDPERFRAIAEGRIAQADRDYRAALKGQDPQEVSRALYALTCLEVRYDIAQSTSEDSPSDSLLPGRILDYINSGRLTNAGTRAMNDLLRYNYPEPAPAEVPDHSMPPSRVQRFMRGLGRVYKAARSGRRAA